MRSKVLLNLENMIIYIKLKLYLRCDTNFSVSKT